MTNFEKLKTMTVDELADWLNENCQHDEAPWVEWFDKNYCKKCEPITCRVEATNIGLEPLFPEQEVDCAYCELENKCRFCPEATGIPSLKTIIKMWLEGEVNND